MTGANDFVKMVPGFEFLQTLMKGAGAGLPAMQQWIAPSLDPEELDKRINELRTVQYWLEQNARLLSTTIQALEVQRLTLTTLKTMNLPLAELQESMKLRMAEAPAPAAAPAPVAEPAAAAPVAAPAIAGPVDPMQWWGALTKQFGEIAATALKDAAANPAAAPSAAVPAGQAATKAVAKKAAKRPAKKAARPKPAAG